MLTEKISFIIPTYNAERFLQNCLKSIQNLDYPKDKLEVIIADGGSQDQTIKIAQSFNTIILNNPNKLAEYGKAVGLLKATGEFIVFIDADNEIASQNWLTKILIPFKEKEVMGVESNWLMNSNYSFVNKYCCLIRLEDPLSRRLSFLAHNSNIEDKGEYILYNIKPGRFPCFGANGFIWRKEVFKDVFIEDSYDEHDFAAELFKKKPYKVGNVKNIGIYHYHVDKLSDFLRKRARQPHLFYERKNRKTEVWLDNYSQFKFNFAVLYCSTFIGPIIESIFNFMKRPHLAWFLHPFLSFSTIVIYSFETLKIKRANKII